MPKPWEKYQSNISKVGVDPALAARAAQERFYNERGGNVNPNMTLTPIAPPEEDASIAKPWEKYQGLSNQQPAQPQQQGNAGNAREAFGLALSGGQIPFANKLTSAMAAGAVAPFLPETFGELYDEAQAYTKATQAAHPSATLAGNIAGAVSTLPLASSKALFGTQAATQGVRGAINAIPQGLSAVGRFATGGKAAKDAGFLAKTGSLALRSAKGAVVAAPVAGAYAAGEADKGQGMEAFKSGAGMGAALGAAVPVAGAALGAAAAGTGKIYKGFNARDTEALESVWKMIKGRADDSYQLAESLGANLNPQAAQKVSASLQGIIKDPHTKASQRLYSSTISAISDLNEDLAAGNTGLMTLDKHRQILGNIAKDIGNPNRAQEAKAASEAIDAIDNVIEGLDAQSIISNSTDAVDALLTARKEWARQKKFENISDIVEASSGDANKLKRDLESFRLKLKKNRGMGWSNDEILALEHASGQTTAEGILKAFGKFGFDLGSGRSVGNTALPIMGGLLSGFGGLASGIGAAALTPAAAVPIVGTAARMSHKMMARATTDDLLRVIENGGALTPKMVNSLPKQEQQKLLSRIMQMSPARSGLVSNSERTR